MTRAVLVLLLVMANSCAAQADPAKITVLSGAWRVDGQSAHWYSTLNGWRVASAADSGGARLPVTLWYPITFLPTGNTVDYWVTAGFSWAAPSPLCAARGVHGYQYQDPITKKVSCFEAGWSLKAVIFGSGTPAPGGFGDTATGDFALGDRVLVPVGNGELMIRLTVYGNLDISDLTMVATVRPMP